MGITPQLSTGMSYTSEELWSDGRAVIVGVLVAVISTAIISCCGCGVAVYKYRSRLIHFAKRIWAEKKNPAGRPDPATQPALDPDPNRTRSVLAKLSTALGCCRMRALIRHRVDLISALACEWLTETEHDGPLMAEQANEIKQYARSLTRLTLAKGWPEDWQTVDAKRINELDECINKFAESLNDSRRAKDAARSDFYRLELYYSPPALSPPLDPDKCYQLYNFDFRKLYNIADECQAGKNLEVFRSTLPLRDITSADYTGHAKFYRGVYFKGKEGKLTSTDVSLVPVLIKLLSVPGGLENEAREELARMIDNRMYFPGAHLSPWYYAVGKTKVLLVFNDIVLNTPKANDFYNDWPRPADNGTIPAGGLSVPLVEIDADDLSPPVSPKWGGSTDKTRFRRSDDMLGSGSYKIVYKARDHEDCVDVAWCEVRVKDPSNERETERIHREMTLLSTLVHQNIISYVDSWTDGDHIILITELMSGTLRQYVMQMKEIGSTIEVSDIAKHCRQILLGLSHMHGQTPPIIHRDLKGDNILIDSNRSEVKIGDFGVSRILEETHAETFVGTPQFMAPEMFVGTYDEGVDVYSFGMCVLEMATGTIPYGECGNSFQVYEKVSQGILPESLATVTDATVRDFIQRCLLPRDTRPSVEDLATHPLMLGDRLEVQADGTFIVTLNLTIAGKPREVEFWFDETEDRIESVVQQRLAELRLNEADSDVAAVRIRAALRCRPQAGIAMPPPVANLDPTNLDQAGLMALPDGDDRINGVAFLTNNTMLTAAGRYIKLWDHAGRCIGGLDQFRFVSCIAVSKNGLIASGDESGKVCLWKPDGLPLRVFKGHTGYVTGLAFSPDGKTLVSGSLDNKVRVWDVYSDECMKLKGHKKCVLSVAISPDGKTVISGSSDMTIRVWKSCSRSLVTTLKGHTDCVASVAFSPDGTLLASGSYDKTIRLWDTRNWKCVRELNGHDAQVFCVTFSPDGKTLASGSWDQTVNLWDTVSRKSFKIIGFDDLVLSLAFSPDGSTLLCGFEEDTTKLWRLPQL
ncbi:Protein kinase domain [Carpediemonas membranifera]|uniref:Protein kinase domain n=1 Tax=Carpediemonas membranifera TaxID=201153 RepID=A0A8J6AYI1_9EUKA|nr:Protein kinase domain [Carpediemonas membranifera]|eukprot:KAG9391548.1 Protein kinase domain [Carpediemonas membranifera]